MKVLMFAHEGSLNRGCEAIVRSSTAMIKDRIEDAKVYLASGRPETDRMLTRLNGVYDGSARTLSTFSWDWCVSALLYKVFRDDSYAYGKIHENIIKHIKEVDMCLSIGGDNYCYGEQPGWYEIDKRVKSHGKKLVLWGCSIGEEDMSVTKLEDLRRFDLILARESLTYEMLQSKGLTNVKRCADAAFTMEKELLELPDGWKEGDTIGINFSPLVLQRKEGSGEAVKELIRYILETTESAVALTPHVIEHGNNDYEVLRQFYEEWKDTERVVLLPDHLNAVQYKGYISRMRFFIGARTHATIAAYSSGVPTMALGYSVKSKGIAKDLFGEEKLVLSIHELCDSAKLRAGFEEMKGEEEALKRTLAQAIPCIKQLSYQAVDYLKELA